MFHDSYANWGVGVKMGWDLKVIGKLELNASRNVEIYNWIINDCTVGYLKAKGDRLSLDNKQLRLWGWECVFLKK